MSVEPASTEGLSKVAAPRAFVFCEPARAKERSDSLTPAAAAASPPPPAAAATISKSSKAESTLDASTVAPEQPAHRPPEVIGARDIALVEAAARPLRSRSSDAGDGGEKKSADVRLHLPTVASTTKEEDATSQSIYLTGDDLQLELVFYFRSEVSRVGWWIACLVSVGIIYLVGFYSPRFWIWANCRRTALPAPAGRKGKTWVSIKTKHEPVAPVLLTTRTIKPVSSSWLFPPSMRLPPTSSAAFVAGQARPICNEGNADAQVTQVSLLNYRSTSLLLTPKGFVPLSSWRDPVWTSRAAVEGGLKAPEEVEVRKAIFGSNVVDIEVPSWGRVTVDEALHPFYIFSLCSIALWSYDDYQWYALCIGVISLIGIAASVISTKRALARLQNMSRFICEVRVLRSSSEGEKQASSQWEVVDSSELVPGDIIDIAASGAGKLDVLPCDCVLLEADAISSEAMLTGEAVPVVKSACPNALLKSVLAAAEPLTRLDKHALYGGTSLVRARAGATDEASRALVVQTAFNTAKGSLVRQMLFPKPIRFSFYTDGYRFILILAVIALITFVGTLANFIQVGVDDTEIALRSLDLFTICVPPALPAAMSVCTTLAIARLRKAQIYCTSPRRINVAGKVSTICFDKTGTLTESQLDVMGVRNASRNSGSDGNLSELCSSYEQLEADGNEAKEDVTLSEAFATSHDLNMLDGAVLGEPLEAAMFAWSGAILDDEPRSLLLQQKDESAGVEALDQDGAVARVPIVRLRNGEERAVVTKYAFDSVLRRATVVSKAEGQEGARVYCKGAPEAVAPFCNSASLPADFDVVLNRYTHQGYRVLALAGKSLPALSWSQAQAMPRATAESGLVMLGLLIFENKLKPGSKAAIAKLHRALLPTKMCTGDAPLTAIAVARDAEMIPPGAPVFMARISGAVKSGDDEKATQLEWVDVDNEHNTLDAYSLQPIAQGLRLADVALALTGDTFRHLLQHGAKETVERALVHAVVFARMAPEQKQEMVEQLQELEHTVAFVGDGSNDCGALKAADIGLSLSQADASVAAPFTSREEDVDCIDMLLREGRNSITTSIALFSWMMVYSMAQFWCVTLQYTRSTSFNNAEYLYIDVFLVLPIAMGMANNYPAKILSRITPPSRLMSRRVVLSLLSQMVLLLLASATAFLLLHRQSWYVAPELNPDDLVLEGFDNTVLFKQSVWTYTTAALLWSYGPPHRRALWRNWLLCAVLVVLLAVNAAVLGVNSPNGFFDLFSFEEIPPSFLGVIAGIALIQAALATLSEVFLVDRMANALQRPVRAIQAWTQSRKRHANANTRRAGQKRFRSVAKSIASES